MKLLGSKTQSYCLLLTSIPPLTLCRFHQIRLEIEKQPLQNGGDWAAHAFPALSPAFCTAMVGSPAE